MAFGIPMGLGALPGLGIQEGDDPMTPNPRKLIEDAMLKPQGLIPLPRTGNPVVDFLFGALGNAEFGIQGKNFSVQAGDRNAAFKRMLASYLQGRNKQGETNPRSITRADRVFSAPAPPGSPETGLAMFDQRLQSGMLPMR